MDHVLSGEGPWPAKSPLQLRCFREKRPAQHRLTKHKHTFFTPYQQYYIPKIPILILLSDHVNYHTCWQLAEFGYQQKKSKNNKLSESMFPFLSTHSNISHICSVWQLSQKGA